MAQTYILKDILAQAKKQGFNRRRNATTWFQKVAEIASGKVGNPDALLTRTGGSIVNAPRYGGMYMYWYDPKTKEKLKYYDRFPLIFCTGSSPGGWTGLNIHYLFPASRAELMGGLFRGQTSNKYDLEQTVANNLQFLSSRKRLRYWKPAFKKYLGSHVTSRIVRINPDYWVAAAFLPTARFAKQSKQLAWSDSENAVQH